MQKTLRNASRTRRSTAPVKPASKTTMACPCSLPGVIYRLAKPSRYPSKYTLLPTLSAVLIAVPMIQEKCHLYSSSHSRLCRCPAALGFPLAFAFSPGLFGLLGSCLTFGPSTTPPSFALLSALPPLSPSFLPFFAFWPFCAFAALADSGWAALGAGSTSLGAVGGVLGRRLVTAV